MKALYFLGWSSYRLYFKLYHRWEIYGAENVPLEGPVILASNHASFLDPPLVGAALHREINYLARDTLFRFPVIGSILRNVNAVPVDREGRGAAGLRAIIDRLKQGGGIILFPEGTRTRDGELQPAKSGIGFTVLKCPAPVVPVHVFGTFGALHRGQTIPRPRKIIVVFGKALDFSALRAEAETCPKARLREIYEQTTTEIMQAIAALTPPRK